jgi:hypothetical protein
VAVFRSIVALLQPYTLGLIGFQVIPLLIQQNGKYKIIHFLAYLSRLDIAVNPNGKSGCVSGISMDHFQVSI